MRAPAAGTHRPRSRPVARPPHGPRLLVFALLALLAAGCAGTPGPGVPHVPPGAPPAGTAHPSPPGRPARPRPAPGYAGLRDSLGSVDAGVLRDRRIVLDPGHGGWFKGSIGVDSTTEAQVNLGVALALDSLLRAAGAQVRLTRATDRDFTTPGDSTLKSDLAERVRIANAFAPDLFVSIHHNADPGGAHDVNETQTYYKLGDEGPSYDAATDVHRSLVRNLGIETQKLLPGNFAVVRGEDGPALLTEASYLTNPDVEALLRTPAAQRLEAEALYLGIARFFSRRVPVVERFAADTAGRPDGVPLLAASVRGEFDDARLDVDGVARSPQRTGDSLWWTPALPLGSGAHTALLRVRLAGEGSARPRALAFRVDKSFHRVEADFPDAPWWDGRDPLALRVRAFDEDGLPLPDTLHVRVRPRGGHSLPADTVVTLVDGEGWAYFRATPAARAHVRTAFEFRVRPVARILDLQRRRLASEIVVAEPWRRGRAATHREGFVRVQPGDEPLAGAPGTGPGGAAGAWLDRNGFARLAADSAGRARVPVVPGFRAWGADTAWPPRVVAIAGGALAGRRIVLDPEGGGDDAAGVGPSGTRASTLNLEVARALAGMLSAAGADVKLTRDGDAAVSEVERVQAAEAFRPDRYLRIGHAAIPPVAGHYFSSAGGRHWGAGVARACAELGLADSLPVTDVARYALTQVSCVALYTSLARVDSAADESRLLAPGARRAEAYALFVALAREFAPDAAWPVDSLDVRDAQGRPLAGAPVTLGGALVLQSDASGRVRFLRTEPGPLRAVVRDDRAEPRELLLDSVDGRTRSGGR